MNTRQGFKILPYVANILKETKVINSLLDLQEKDKKYATEKGQEILMQILEKGDKIGGDIIKILSITEERKVKEIEEDNFVQSVKKIIEILMDKDFLALLQQVV